MMRSLILLPAAVALVAAAPTGASDQIKAAMEASAAGWNAGSLDRFVAIYADDASYVGKDGLVNGKAAIADRYRASFVAGGNKRGRLSFQPLAFRALSPVHEILWARWTLTPADAGAKPDTGMTTLVFERRKEGWKIISDHSS